jgi:hypothetical protein
VRTSDLDPDGFAAELLSQLRVCIHHRMRALRPCQFCDAWEAKRGKRPGIDAWDDDDDGTLSLWLFGASVSENT